MKSSFHFEITIIQEQYQLSGKREMPLKIRSLVLLVKFSDQFEKRIGQIYDFEVRTKFEYFI